MQKTKAKIMTILLLTAMTLTFLPLVHASTGNILIDDSTPPQDLPITPVPAGGNITLYFGGVTFSGSQFYLLLSSDGLSQVSSGDIRYTPLMDVASMRSATSSVITDAAYPGRWTIGENWVNGTIPTNIAGGNYYIKAFDGFTTALAVTQGFPVSASLRIIPAQGAAGTDIIVSANAFPPNALVNFSYVSVNPPGTVVRFANLTQTNALGQVNITMPAPDLKIVPDAGDTGMPVPTNTIEFQAVQNGTTTPVVYTANYVETQRGLVQFGRPDPPGPVQGSLQNATGIYGNLTSFVSTVSVGVGNTLRVVGNSFYPGPVTMLWDNSVDVAPAGFVANQTGWFNATFAVPATGLGAHNITMIDNGLQKFIVFVNVVQSISLNVTSGAIGTPVLVTGYGFPSQGVPAGNTYNVTITFGTSATIRASGMTDATGKFTASFAVPAGSAGGANTVAATANDTVLTSATATFTVGSAFTVTPSSFYANSSSTEVVATGTGFPVEARYYVAIDNLFSPFSDTVNGIAPGSSGSSLGVVTFRFVGVGFQPGLHVVSLYEVGGNNRPVANATFTVLTDATDVLGAINATVTSIKNDTTIIKSDTTTMKANLTTIIGWGPTITNINNGVATIQGTLGTMTQTLSSMQATLNSVSGQVATISTSIGSMQAELSAINAKVTSIEGKFVTIETSLGTIEGVVDSIDSRTATIWTDVGTLTMDVATLQDSVDSIPGAVNLWVYIAIALAAIAAIASIITLVIVRQKIAA